MNRRHFLWTTVLAAGAVPALGRAEERPLAPDAPKPGAPTVSALTTDTVAIVWGVNGPCTGFVEYGPTPELGRVAHGAIDGLRPYDSASLAVRLPGLKPGERVHCRTVTAPIAFPNHYAIRRGAAVASPVFDFRMPGPGDSAKVAVCNDTHGQTATLAALAMAADAFAPDLLALNGDLVADQFAGEGDFTATFAGLAVLAGERSPRPVAFVRGNHDARGALARELPRFAPRPAAGGYHGLLRVGPVGILRLDTGDDKEGPGIYGGMGDFAAYRDEQRLWLERAVADPDFAGAPFKIVLCHIPLRWKKPDAPGAWCADGDARWSPLLAKAGVHAVISGHTHEFWHDAPNADRPFHQITSGGPQTTASRWSPTPACLVTLEAAGRALDLRVTEALSGKEHLNLRLDA